MGYDKYGLNWSLWGDTAKEPEKSSFDPSDTVGKGWGNAPKQTLEEDRGDDEPAPEQQQQAITCTLRNARFLPDEETAFCKPCKVTVDIESQQRVTTQVTFSLFARYTDKNGDTHEHDQGIVKKVDPADDSKSATTELKLTTDVPDFDSATGEQLEYVFLRLFERCERCKK